MQKEILYIRHKLQKGMLTRGIPPKENDMPDMAKCITHLEKEVEVEAGIIQTTKIDAVLEQIVKLEGIPRDSEFRFKERSRKLLERWKGMVEGGEKRGKNVKMEEGDDD